MYQNNLEQGNIKSFREFLRDGVSRGGFETDDILAAVLPLMREVLERHDDGQVAPLMGTELLNVSHNVLWFHVSEAIKPKRDVNLIESFLPENVSGTIVVVDREDHTHDIDRGEKGSMNLRVWDEEQTPPKVVVYATGYRSWEHLVGYHDELTDIFSLGLLMASFATGLDFYKVDELCTFEDHRASLHHYCPRLHPVVTTMIVKMTELHRKNRIQDLRSIIKTLENYRDQSALIEDDLLDTGKDQPKVSRRHLINLRLRDRLFDLSKRNRLIHFRTTLQTINLTVSSVPLVLNYKNIRPEQLFTWQPKIAEALVNESSISLDRYLRYEEAPYLPHALDGIRRKANKDIKEYGFSELRLVLVFFRWHNLKDDKNTRIDSPLLLHPVELVKKKGVRDSWRLEPSGSVAEVNPALKFQLKQLYNLELPDSIDFATTSLESFYDELEAKIKASEPAVQLKKIDKPQIDLAVEKAKKRLDRFLKRRSSRAKKTYSDIKYSYKRTAYEPLGLQLFLQRVQPVALPLEYLISEKPSLRTPGISENDQSEMNSEVKEQVKKEEVKTRHTYNLRQGSDHNPYVWDFDQCSLTLANFSYRKMSLVRDYNTLLQQNKSNDVFDEIFSLNPKQILEKVEDDTALKEQFLIVPADSTQISAIASARRGNNIIIQGPPGTGKSQTIANLIADYVARGKRVLFVCEKRAALDVVHQRLAASGLEELTCLIHDSQTDKKAFIMNLKETYEKFISSRVNRKIEKEAELLAEEVESELSFLEQFGDVMFSKADDISIRSILDCLILLKGDATELSDEEEELFPDYSIWKEYGEVVKKLERTLTTEISLPDYFSETSFAKLNPSSLFIENPLSTLRANLDRALPRLLEIEEEIKDYSFDTSGCSLEELVALSFVSENAEYLAKHGILSLINESSSEMADLIKFKRDKTIQESVVKKVRQKNQYWTEKLSSRETDAALDQAKLYEGSVLRLLKPGYYKLKGVMKKSYNFSEHTISPSWTTLLTDLKEEHKEQTVLDEIYTEIRSKLGVQDVDSLFDHVESFNARKDAVTVDKEDKELFISSLIKNNSDAQSTVRSLAAIQKPLDELMKHVNELLRDGGKMMISSIIKCLKDLDKELPLLRELLIDLRDLKDAPDSLLASLQKYSFNSKSFEYSCAHKSLNKVYFEKRGVEKFDGDIFRRRSHRAHEAYKEWMGKNGERIANRVKAELKDLYNLASKSDTKLTKKESLEKSRFNKGRRELEHEFGKTMRYKSIRDLSTGVSGEVILRFKPIWLMSPLSISDTMPLEDNPFDLVIFDEASQVRLEEAVPAIQRAKQLIVVGDEMQLPPTNFFDSSDNSEEEALYYEEDGDQVEYDLGAESFLTHSGKTLPSVMLGWHYRSRYESLIRFSSKMFYGGELLTIPDRVANVGARNSIEVGSNRGIPDYSMDVLSRSISYHFMKDGVYEKRQNIVEAEYIAETVRNLFAQESGKSFGIVAFSEAQQQKIEEALQHLAKEDEEFRKRLDLEMEREEDGQFCGLFVKNLENVQGDERDIMILSICYAPDSKGKMRMNFGPINRSGGEKRLNVIFSRAKHHMMIVSSIQHHQITNDYNVGAHSLKKFLEYAEYVSIGDFTMAAHALSVRDRSENSEGDSDVCREQIFTALEKRGYHVEMNVGQSKFTCDLALRKEGDKYFQLGILLDGKEHYEIQSPMERYVLRPNVLRAFDWEVVEVLAKDWFHEPEKVLKTIDQYFLRGHNRSEV